MITQQELKHLFIYEPETGLLRNRVARINSPKGTVISACNGRGYVSLHWKKKQYLVHRLAWLYVFGKWPKEQLHHIDGNKTNNRIDNLREVTCRENNQQKLIHKTKLVGACLDRGRWKASIQKGKRRIHIGHFATELEAHRAYMKEAATCR